MAVTVVNASRVPDPTLVTYEMDHTTGEPTTARTDAAGALPVSKTAAETIVGNSAYNTATTPTSHIIGLVIGIVRHNPASALPA